MKNEFECINKVFANYREDCLININESKILNEEKKKYKIYEKG